MPMTQSDHATKSQSKDITTAGTHISFLSACQPCREFSGAIDTPDPEWREQMMERKHAYALLSLNEKQPGLSTYDKTVSRVFTPEFVAELEQANMQRRFMRNPWLCGNIRTRPADALSRSSAMSDRLVVS